MANQAYTLGLAHVGQDVVIWPLAKIVAPEIVSVGEELDLKVINLDSDERRIGLSLKEAKADNEGSVVNKYMDGQHSDRTTLADLMDTIDFEPKRPLTGESQTPSDESSGDIPKSEDEKPDETEEDK